MRRVQRLVRRALVQAAGAPVQARELVRRHGWSWSVYRVLYQYAVRDRWGYWRPNDELMKLIVGEARHSDSDQQQILDEKPGV
jgi:hypothetical protein